MMSELGFWPRFLLAALATWRVTHLLALEDGPGNVLAELRRRLGESFFGRLMDCFYCLSFWVAAPLTLFVSWRPLDAVVTWLALSGAACLLERLGQEPVIMQSISERQDGGTSDGMLRSEAGGDAAERPGEADDAGDSGGRRR